MCVLFFLSFFFWKEKRCFCCFVWNGGGGGGGRGVSLGGLNACYQSLCESLVVIGLFWVFCFTVLPFCSLVSFLTLWFPIRVFFQHLDDSSCLPFCVIKPHCFLGLRASPFWLICRCKCSV